MPMYNELYRTKLTQWPRFFGQLELLIGEGNGTPLQYSCLENPVDGGAWWAEVNVVSKSRTRLSDFTFTHWRRKWQPTPGFLPGESQRQRSLVGCRLWGRRVGHDWSDLAVIDLGVVLLNEHFLALGHLSCVVKVSIYHLCYLFQAR